MAAEQVVRPRMQPASQASSFVGGVQRPEPFTLVLFGATGDLAARKLFPALNGLSRRGLLPERFVIVGLGRKPKTDAAFRQEVEPSLKGKASTLLPHLYYQQADVTQAEAFLALRRRLESLEKEQGLPGHRLFYLSVDPQYFGPTVESLAGAGLIQREREHPWTRVVIEKPFGHDLESAKRLDWQLHCSLRPDQIYRIDHYLGKETVQNLLAFRFGNAIFEPLFNRLYVDHVQITVAETLGMEGKRGGFYDSAGALRDLVQNHMLQLLALVAMDPPATLTAGDLSDAKLKVLRDLLPMSQEDIARQVVRGQYGAGTIDGKAVGAYREEEGVAQDSTTETFVALRLQIESWRWAGVPFLLRTGKRLPRRVTEIAVQFKLPPLQMFRTVECEGDYCDLTDTHPSVLCFRIQPNEGISLSFSAKRPGMQLDLHPVRFEFDYSETFPQELPEAYERLLLDALRGDATLFMRSDELQAAWEFITPILRAWQAPRPAFPNYAAGTWGPPEANRLAADVGGWRTPVAEASG